jgi:uncharacterized membrane protein
MPRSWPKRIALALLSAFFVFMGVMHFVAPEGMVASVPTWLPNAALLVAVSGVFEILGGVGVLVPQTRRLAGYGLIALLVAVYPANIHMAMSEGPWTAQGVPAWLLWARLPFQFLFIAWAWWATKPDAGAAEEGIAWRGSSTAPR